MQRVRHFWRKVPEMSEGGSTFRRRAFIKVEVNRSLETEPVQGREEARAAFFRVS